MQVEESELFRALLDLTKSIDGGRDLKALCSALSGSLRRIVPFDFLGIVLHDPMRDELRLLAFSTDRQQTGRDVVLPANGNDIAAVVWREQEPLVLSPLQDFEHGESVVRQALQEGINALTLVPLSNGARRLGILAFGFAQPFCPAEESLVFLRRVAAETALAVDGYLTLRALAEERDRVSALFDITNSLVSKLPIKELFPAISDQLSRVVVYDFAWIGLLDSKTGELQLTALHSPAGIQLEQQARTPPDGLPAGEAILSGRPVTFSGPDFDRFRSPVFRKYASYGFRSGCSIPFRGKEGFAGVLDVARTSGAPFTNDEVDLLVPVTRQIAIALENSLMYQELSELKDKLATEKLYLEDEIRLEQNVGTMVGDSPAFHSVLRSIQIVARTDATVLIHGETGTGKELVARAIHDLSERDKRSFIKVNCAAIPAALLESELFGHEKGSFTGAFAQKIGRFELAHQGTLFLDEIGEIPLELQPKLLRALQEQEFERVGGSRTVRVDVRIVAATNRDLKRMVENGQFRSDLYFRLHVFPLSVPPLRERLEDIPLLVRYFTQKHAKRLNRPIEEIPSTALEDLAAYSWPGNIRELQNLIERSVILSPGKVLLIEPPRGDAPSGPASGGPCGSQAAERARILAALQQCGWKVAGPGGAAARLGIPRTTLQSRMKKFGIARQYG
ncbi:MAG: sigma 54-interacting transcriptional regulator [Bryobacteraceae bacterium]|nr:sigma 54-interacting transcriptional regulator [Bryobacteraceae bacterium]